MFCFHSSHHLTKGQSPLKSTRPRLQSIPRFIWYSLMRRSPTTISAYANTTKHGTIRSVDQHVLYSGAYWNSRAMLAVHPRLQQEKQGEADALPQCRSKSAFGRPRPKPDATKRNLRTDSDHPAPLHERVGAAFFPVSF